MVAYWARIRYNYNIKLNKEVTHEPSSINRKNS